MSGAGLVDSISSPDTQTLHYRYDGPLVLEERTSGVLASTVTLTYDPLLRVKSQTVNGDSIALGYDADQRLTGAGLASLHYNATGLIDSTTLTGLTATSSLDYNPYGELRNLRHAWNGGTFLQSMTRDPLGRIADLTETTDSARTLTYTYTTAGRLHQVRRGSNLLEEYAYDGNGNRTTSIRWLSGGADTALATFDDQDRMTAYGSAAYDYNPSGELVHRIVGSDTTSYTYDPLGNLLKVRLPSDDPIVTYKVDGRNRRVAKYVNGVFQRGWIYQDGLRVVGELDSTGTLAIRYVYGSRGHVPDYLIRYGTTYRIIADQLGSLRMVVDASTGAVAESLGYDAWGRVVAQKSPGFVSLGFAGGLYDHQTGLVRFGARDYDPAVGRWTCKDPAGFEGGDANLVAYCGGDPVTRPTNWPAA